MDLRDEKHENLLSRESNESIETAHTHPVPSAEVEGSVYGVLYSGP